MSPLQGVDLQIQFARHAYENQQSVIRVADTKAGAMASLLAFLGFSGILLMRAGVDVIGFDGRIKAALTAGYCATVVIFILTVLWTLFAVLHVIKPRTSGQAQTFCKGENLFFSGDVARYEESEYFCYLQSADPDTILRNLTNELVRVSQIAERKMSALPGVHLPLVLAFSSWALNMLFTLSLLGLRTLHY